MFYIFCRKEKTKFWPLCFYLVIFITAFFWIFLVKPVSADYCCVCKNSSGDCQWIDNTNCWGKPEMEPFECTVAACKEWCPGHPGNPMEATFRSQNCSILSECAGSVPPIPQTHCCVTNSGCNEVNYQSECNGKIYLTTDCNMVQECSKPPQEEKETPIVIPTLQIQVPGFQGFTKEVEICLEEGKTLEECQKEQRGYAIPWIGEYIVAIYKWSIGAIAILAVIMIMVGGFQWLMAGGDVGKISDAKSRMTYAVIGLVLILGSNLLLTSINPNLTILPSIIIGKIERIELENEELGFGEVSGCPDLIPDPTANCKPGEIINKAQTLLGQVSGPCHCVCYVSRILRSANCGLPNPFTSVQGIEAWLQNNGWQKTDCDANNNKKLDNEEKVCMKNAPEGAVFVQDGHIGLSLGNGTVIESGRIKEGGENNCDRDATSCSNATVWHGLGNYREWTSDKCKTNQTVKIRENFWACRYWVKK